MTKFYVYLYECQCFSLSCEGFYLFNPYFEYLQSTSFVFVKVEQIQNIRRFVVNGHIIYQDWSLCLLIYSHLSHPRLVSAVPWSMLPSGAHIGSFTTRLLSVAASKEDSSLAVQASQHDVLYILHNVSVRNCNK